MQYLDGPEFRYRPNANRCIIIEYPKRRISPLGPIFQIPQSLLCSAIHSHSFSLSLFRPVSQSVSICTCKASNANCQYNSLHKLNPLPPTEYDPTTTTKTDVLSVDKTLTGCRLDIPAVLRWMTMYHRHRHHELLGEPPVYEMQINRRRRKDQWFSIRLLFRLFFRLTEQNTGSAGEQH